jgi:hypothetical protein
MKTTSRHQARLSTVHGGTIRDGSLWTGWAGRSTSTPVDPTTVDKVLVDSIIVSRPAEDTWSISDSKRPIISPWEAGIGPIIEWHSESFPACCQFQTRFVKTPRWPADNREFCLVHDSKASANIMHSISGHTHTPLNGGLP